MKNTTKIITLPLLLAGILLVCMACKERETYYQFTSEDNQRLLPYTVGQVLKFTNQNNEERVMSISAIERFKESEKTGGMGLYTTRFFYDKKDIVLFDSTMGRSFTIHFYRSPIDYNLAMEDNYTKYPSEFYGNIAFFQSWNGNDRYISINYGQRKVEMTVNRKTYKNVFLIASGVDTIVRRDNGIGNIIYRDVNVMYYDEIEGIIGFDDLNNNEWRLSN
jgi:hypothetical protein